MLEDEGALGEVCDIEAEVIEEAEGEFLELRVFIDGFDGFEEVFGLGGWGCA